MSNKNEYTESTLIITSKKYGKVTCILDPDKIEEVKTLQWSVSKTGNRYTTLATLPKESKYNTRGLSLGQLIILDQFKEAQSKEPSIVTFLNGNTLDFRAENLSVLPLKEHRKNTKAKNAGSKAKS